MRGHQAGRPVIGLGLATKLIAGQRMADQNCIALIGVERAIGLERHRQRSGDAGSAGKLQRRVASKAKVRTPPAALTRAAEVTA